MSHSSRSLVEISRSKSRYHDQDALLRAFAKCPGCTAKEVAVSVLRWQYEHYCNAPKRASDLKRLGYLEQLPGKVCRYTRKEAHTYRITDRGMAYLRSIGRAPVMEVPVVPVQVSDPVHAKEQFSKIRDLLGG